MAGEGCLGMGPHHDCIPPTVCTAVNSCPDKDSDVNLLVLTWASTLPPFSEGDQGEDGGMRAKLLPLGKRKVYFGSAGEASGPSPFSGQSAVCSLRFFTSVLLVTEQTD